jgi:nitric oxide reductase subunit C
VLSKSQARLFFFGGTLFFSAIFIGLTVDTVRQVPALSNQDRMTAEVVRGTEIWDQSNCMGCHTILGEGAYYAPELTRVVQRRGVEWIAIFLKGVLLSGVERPARIPRVCRSTERKVF